MASGYTVTNLSAYVEQNKDTLIKGVILGGDLKDATIPHLAKQLGVKSKEMLNYLNVEAVLQNGRGCGFNASGTTELSEREIEVASIKANDQFCPDALLGKYAEYLVKIGANENAANMPFEGEIAGGIATSIEEQIEKLIWKGDKANGDLIDGFLTQALGADSASTIAVSAGSGSTYNAIKAVIMAVPERIVDKAVVNVAPAVYRAYIQELVEKNLYHYNPADGAPVEMFFPGTGIKVRNCKGLEGDKRHIYASAWENMVYGTDAMNDKEQFRLWFSDDDDLFKYKVKFNAGVKTYFPDFVVVGTATADLV